MARRILLLITDLEIGGTPTVVREVARRLNAPPHVEVQVACLKPLGPVGEQLRDAGVRVTAFGAARAWHLPGTLWRLRRLVRERGIDTVFSFLVHANAVAALASRSLPGVRFIQSIQTTQPRPAWHWRLQSWIHGAADAVVVPSPSVAKVAQVRSGIPAEKLVVIPNAIDPNAFAPSPVPRTDPRPFPVGFIGRLDPIKRIGDLIEAVKLLNGLAQLHVFGQGPELRGLIALGGGACTWHGAIARPQEALAQIGLLALPSEAEGFGLVLIEAMAAAVPVVATNVPGICDVVQNETNGLLVPVASPAELSRTIARLINDRPLRDRLIRAGLKTARDQFSWEVVLPQYRSLLGLTGSG